MWAGSGHPSGLYGFAASASWASKTALSEQSGAPPHPLTVLDGVLRMLGLIEGASQAKRP